MEQKNFLTDEHLSFYIKVKRPQTVVVSKPVYLKNDDGTFKLDSNRHKVRLFKNVKNEKTGEVERVPVNEFSEKISYNLDYSGCTLGSHVLKASDKTMNIIVQKTRDAGVEAVKALDGQTIDVASLFTERTPGVSMAFRAVEKMTAAGDVDALEALAKSIEERISKMK